MKNAVCLGNPKYDGLCVCHADTDAKTAEEMVSDRADVSKDVLRKHYDRRSKTEKMERRRDYLNNI